MEEINQRIMKRSNILLGVFREYVMFYERVINNNIFFKVNVNVNKNEEKRMSI